MSTIILPPGNSRLSPLSDIRLVVTLALTGWFLLVLTLGAAGAFLGRPGTPPIGIAIATTVPLLFFFAWLRFSRSFRGFIFSLDPRLITAMQAWRFAGLGFLFLYAYKVLPAVFALPAGLGDMAIGIAAPWLIVALTRDRRFATSAAFIRWNWLGILDLIVALGLGAASATLTAGDPGEISAVPMATLPLLLVPAFLVPLFLMLHAVALMQSRQILLEDG
ncbi:MAG: hypothetical protein ACTHMO_10810 [Rhodanobacteraceae bacterium]